MGFKGTKGEWSYNTTKKGHCKISAHDWHNFCKVYTVVGGCSDYKDVTQANAKLICAAPDLLEALTMLIEETEDYVNKTACGNTYLDIARGKARKAIEKALL